MMNCLTLIGVILLIDKFIKIYQDYHNKNSTSKLLIIFNYYLILYAKT